MQKVLPSWHFQARGGNIKPDFLTAPTWGTCKRCSGEGISREALGSHPEYSSPHTNMCTMVLGLARGLWPERRVAMENSQLSSLGHASEHVVCGLRSGAVWASQHPERSTCDRLQGTGAGLGTDRLQPQCPPYLSECLTSQSSSGSRDKP